jgi:serine/threonine-protein kinase RsbW
MFPGRMAINEPRAMTGDGMGEVTAAPPLVWCRAFPAVPAQVGQARRFLAGILEGFPAADEAVLCLSELAANATVHSRSRHGGHYTVRAELHGRRLRVAVRDQGGPWAGPGVGGEQHGRGLLIVSRLATRWGREGHAASGWTVWFELDRS